MNSRFLTILNTIGCLVLTGLVVAQWFKERSIHQELTAALHQIASSREQTAQESQRRGALERDIAVLKEAIESSQQSAESTTRELSAKSTLASDLEKELATARTQLAAWETAVKSRDERINTLTTDLAATRQRLDQAIAKLKAAADR